MSELDDALTRARSELAETKAAIDAARGGTIEALAEQLAALQAQTAESEAGAAALADEVQALRDEEQVALAKLAE